MYVNAKKACRVQQSERKEFGGWDAQCFGDTVDIFERNIAFSPFRLSDIGKMQPYLGSEGLLRQPVPLSYLLQLFTKLDENIFVCHHSGRYKGHDFPSRDDESYF